MALNLDLIKKKLTQLQTNSNRSAYQWKPQPGKTQIRVVPYQHNKDNPFVELLFHYNVGKKSYMSLETFGEEDPICEFAEQLKSTGDKEDWKLGKKLEPSMRTYVPIIVRGAEKEGVKFWGFGKEVYKELLSIINDPDYGDITDLDSGHDVVIEFTSAKDAGNSYGKIVVRPKPQKTAATTDEAVMDMILNRQPSIFDIFKKNTYEELETALKKWLEFSANKDEVEETDEQGSEEEQEPEDESTEEPEEEKPVIKPTVKKEEKPVIEKAPSKTVKGTKDVSKAFSDLFDDKK